MADLRDADKRIREASQKIENVNRDIEEVKTQLEDSNHVLGEKKGELNDIVNETRQDEEHLRKACKQK